MKVISPSAHGVLDYVTVVAFALAPTVVGFSGLPATICYVLAAVHLVLTLVTAFGAGVAKLVPFHLHGRIELVVSLVLIVLPWLLGFAGVLAARWFFVGAGVVIFLVWLLTAYSGPRAA
jgi:hypothetical protein